MPCDACGYNLRGVQDVFCPECGRVIPRPPADAAQRMRTAPEDLKLYCESCGYAVTGADPGRCPECGTPDLARYRGDRPPAVRRRRLTMGVPFPLLLLGAIGLVFALLGASLAAAGAAGSRIGAGRGAYTVLGAVLCLGPAGLAAAWFCHRPAIRKLEIGERVTLSRLATLVGGVVLGVGIWIAIG